MMAADDGSPLCVKEHGTRGGARVEMTDILYGRHCAEVMGLCVAHSRGRCQAHEGGGPGYQPRTGGEDGYGRLIIGVGPHGAGEDVERPRL